VRRKTILILAASINQVPLIERARALGYRVLTTDNRPDNPGHRLADAAFDVDTTDREGILALCREQKVDGVIAAATDVAVPTVAHLAARLGLAGPSPEAADVLCIKHAFRAFQRRIGLPAPATVAMPVGPEGIVHGPSFPLVVKPDQASGSKGIRVVSDAAELLAQFEIACGLSKNGRAIAEQFIVGHQGTLEGVIQAGRVTGCLFLDRMTVSLPHVTTRGHRVPSCLPQSHKARLIEQFDEIVAALTLPDGPFDCDFVCDASEAYILEMSPRLGGNGISAVLETATGLPILTFALATASGPETEAARLMLATCDTKKEAGLPVEWRVAPTGIALLGVTTPGRLSFDAAAAAALRAEAWVHELAFDYEIGSPIAPFTDSSRRIGHCLFEARTRDVLDLRAAEVERRLRIAAA
jgi:biotin carboxylase